MSGIKDQAKIEEMRRRLYERGNPPEQPPRHELSPSHGHTTPVSWDMRPQQQRDITSQQAVSDPRVEVMTEPTVEVEEEPVEDMVNTIAKNARRYTYRSILFLGSIAFFMVVLTITTLYLLFGNNQISSQNIALALTGPLTIGGGEVLPFQATVTNQNKVSIESVVLIVNYPSGAKAADGTERDLYEERMPLEDVESGESRNIPLRAVVFGEENQEHTINATVEYNIKDSNGTFYKQAEPFTFTIHSSPVVIRVDNIEKVSSGQEVEVKLSIQSNASAALKNLLLTANFPANFELTNASPEADFRTDTWFIDELKPEQSIPIVLKGTVTGNQNEEFQIQFAIGSPRQENQYIMGAALASAVANFVIEHPFIDVKTSINGSVGSVVTTSVGDNTFVTVNVDNTLDETLYDMAVEVGISGNILSREEVEVQNGFYDSIKDVIRYEVAGDSKLAEVLPGQRRSFTFTFKPNTERHTPAFEMTASAYARRVNESRVTEQLVGVSKTQVRYTSVVQAESTVSLGSGPVPPVAEETTTYKVNMKVEAGGNDITSASVTTSLPQYVTWENVVVGDGSIEYNPVSKELVWSIGDIPADGDARTTFVISFTPSQSQIGTIPPIVGALRMKATDRFTGEAITAEDTPKNATLSGSGYDRDSGKVIK